jgi:hypothetical protein
MRLPKFRPWWAVAAVLVLAATLLVSRGVVDVLLMMLIITVLAGTYLLRRYARAELLYRPLSEQRRRETERDLVSDAPTTGFGKAGSRRGSDRT